MSSRSLRLVICFYFHWNLIGQESNRLPVSNRTVSRLLEIPSFFLSHLLEGSFPYFSVNNIFEAQFRALRWPHWGFRHLSTAELRQEIRWLLIELRHSPTSDWNDSGIQRDDHGHGAHQRKPQLDLDDANRCENLLCAFFNLKILKVRCQEKILILWTFFSSICHMDVTFRNGRPSITSTNPLALYLLQKACAWKRKARLGKKGCNVTKEGGKRV